MSKEREAAALVFNIAGMIGDGLAKAPDGGVAIAGTAAAAIARTIEAMIKADGPEATKALIERMHAERDKGAITDDVLKADDTAAHSAISGLYTRDRGEPDES